MGPLIQMPAALSYPMNMKKYDWNYYSEPEPSLGNRNLKCPRGRVLGGSSSINGMVYVRGNPGDYDYWSESGAKEWSYANVLPYFKRMETSHGGEEDWRGSNGPLHVSRGSGKNPLNKALRNAIVEAGYKFTDDYNGSRQEGFAAGDMTVWKGSRWSSYRAYLKPILSNRNLKIFKKVLAKRFSYGGITPELRPIKGNARKVGSNFFLLWRQLHGLAIIEKWHTVGFVWFTKIHAPVFQRFPLHALGELVRIPPAMSFHGTI